jgi:hypothetical protein
MPTCIYMIMHSCCMRHQVMASAVVCRTRSVVRLSLFVHLWCSSTIALVPQHATLQALESQAPSYR